MTHLHPSPLPIMLHLINIKIRNHAENSSRKYLSLIFFLLFFLFFSFISFLCFLRLTSKISLVWFLDHKSGIKGRFGYDTRMGKKKTKNNTKKLNIFEISKNYAKSSFHIVNNKIEENLFFFPFVAFSLCFCASLGWFMISKCRVINVFCLVHLIEYI